MWLIGLYYGAQLNLDVMGSYLVNLVREIYLKGIKLLKVLWKQSCSFRKPSLAGSFPCEEATMLVPSFGKTELSEVLPHQAKELLREKTRCISVLCPLQWSCAKKKTFLADAVNNSHGVGRSSAWIGQISPTSSSNIFFFLFACKMKWTAGKKSLSFLSQRGPTNPYMAHSHFSVTQERWNNTRNGKPASSLQRGDPQRH